MGATVTISDEARACAEELVRLGWGATIDEAVDAAVRTVLTNRSDEEDDEDEDMSLLDLSPEDRAAVAEGLADIRAGRTAPIEETFSRLRSKYGAMVQAGAS